MKSVKFTGLLLFVFIVFQSVSYAEENVPKRDPNAFPLSKNKVETSIVQMTVAPQPKKIVVSSGCSSFDLSKSGRMHLLWGGKYVIVYPLNYVGTYSGVYVYREKSPEAWVWYFFPDGHTYYFTKTSGPHLYDSKSKHYTKVP